MPSKPAASLSVAIVGAGAAGLMAAIFAGRSSRAGNFRVAALDGATRIGSKILIAGGGRCNVTHDIVRPDDFNGSNRNLIARVLRSFDVAPTVGFFRDLGVELKREEGGKLFPVSDRAQTVLDALVGEVRSAGAEILSGHRVLAIRRDGDGFLLETSKGDYTARRVVLATGGRSVPKTGSDGVGYELARSLGHEVTRTFPALVPLILPQAHWLCELKGVSADVELTLSASNGKVLRRESGSMLMAHFGLSGPVVLDISRHWIAARRDGDAVLTASFVPGESFERIDAWLVTEAKAAPKRLVATLLRAKTTDRLAAAISACGAGIAEGTMLGRMTRDERRRLAHALTALPLPIVGDRGFDFAEATAGGVPLGEVSSATMESKICPGLFLCGEILDVDGRIGGYNFQWAWASGRLAGTGAGSRKQ